MFLRVFPALYLYPHFGEVTAPVRSCIYISTGPHATTNISQLPLQRYEPTAAG